MKKTKSLKKLIYSLILIAGVNYSSYGQLTYPIVDTYVTDHYSTNAVITATAPGDTYHGQDASYNGNVPSHTDNGDGTITDNVTGLMWAKDMGDQITYDSAFVKAETSTLGGYTDWRIPTIKELVSLAKFDGVVMGDYVIEKFIDTIYFNQPIGDTLAFPGTREIDAQTWSATQYVGLIMEGDTGIFGYNFVDGRLKCYPKYKNDGVTAKTAYFRMVRGNVDYGINNFVDNGDGTISDNATGLMWQSADDGNTYDWIDALDYCENLTLAGYSDWRLPNAKELHSLVDYTMATEVTGEPAIDPFFTCTEIIDPYGDPGQYGYYWTGSPLMDGMSPYSDAVYIAFGQAQGEMELAPPGSAIYDLLNTHGSGAMRNDPKTGLPGDYPDYWGPQNDVRYTFNFVRAVRDIDGASLNEEEQLRFDAYPNPATNQLTVTGEANHIIILDISGQIVLEQNITGNTVIDISNLSPGNYVIHASEENRVVMKKLTIL